MTEKSLRRGLPSLQGIQDPAVYRVLRAVYENLGGVTQEVATPASAYVPKVSSSPRVSAANLGGGVPIVVATSGMTISLRTLRAGANCILSVDGGCVVISNSPRILEITSSATPAVDVDSYDAVTITALAAAITSMTSGLSGTPVNFQRLLYRIKDDGNARAITWGASFEARGVDMPATTVPSKVLTVEFLYDTVTSKWGCISSLQEA